MKYSVLLALLGTSSAIQHHHQSYGTPTENRAIYEDHVTTANDVVKKQHTTEADKIEAIDSADKGMSEIVANKKAEIESQRYKAMTGDVSALMQTPDESRAAWQNTRDASRAAASQQQKDQLEHNKMVAKNYADDVAKTNEKKWHDSASQINMKNGGTTPFRTVTNAALMQTPDESRAAWQATRDASRAAAAEQERFQLEHNKMVAKNYADDVLATNTKKWHDAASQINMKNGGTTPFKTVTNARLDTMYAQQSTPDESRAAWQATRDASRAAAAEQERFQLEHNKMVAKNYADDVLATNTKKWHDAASQINMKNGGTTPFKTVTNARLDTMYAQTQAPPPLGHSDASFIPGKELANKVTERQSSFEEKQTAEIDRLNNNAIKEADAQQAGVKKSRNRQTIGGVSDLQISDGPSLGASDETFQAGKIQAANVTSTQEQYQAEHNAMVKNNNDADIESTNTKKWQVGASRSNMMNGGVNPHPSVKVPAQAPLSFSYVQDNEADKSFVPSVAISRQVTAAQQAFEKAKVADVEARNTANTDETNAFKNAVNLNTKQSRWEFSNYY